MCRTVIRIQDSLNGPESFYLERTPVPIPNGRVQYPLILPAAAAGSVKATGQALFACLAHHPGVQSALQYVLQALPGSANVRPLYVQILGSTKAESQLWEALWDATQGFLALSHNWPVGRITDTALALGPIRRFYKPPLTVVAILTAAGLPALDEWRNLYQAFTGHPTLDFRLRVLLCEDSLAQAINGAHDARVQWEFLRDKAHVRDTIGSTAPDLLHFFCHGVLADQPHLQLATRPGWFVSEQAHDAPENLVRLEANELLEIQGLRDKVWAVVLNCCDGASAATSQSLARTLVAAGLPAVIGMQERVDRLDAAAFCGKFYNSLLQQVENCLTAGAAGVRVEWVNLLPGTRAAILDRYAAGQPESVAADACWEWTRPVVYVRPDPFELVGPPTNLDLAATTRARLLAQLEMLRRLRGQYAARPDLPAGLVADLDAQITALEQQLYA